jgi:multicomponent Na+:H+ antiporter subunit E
MCIDMVIILNLLLTILMTWFTKGIYPGIPSSGFMTLLIFAGWNIVFWLVSFFYNKQAFYKTPIIGMLILFYLKELFLASIRVAYDVITPKDHMKPAIIAVPLEAKTDLEITLLANFITLTPGTLSIDVSEDRKTLYIHEVYVKAGDTEKIIRQIKDGFEKRILQVTR